MQTTEKMGRYQKLSTLFFFFLLVSASSSSSIPAEEEPEVIISRFQEYLRINTSHPNPAYAAAVDFLLSQIKTLTPPLVPQTLEFVPGKPLLLIKWPGSDPSLPSVLLNSHTDVVPSEPSKWSVPPLSATLHPSGRIFARGSQDMKSVGLQHLEAARRLIFSSFTPARTVYFSFVPDEEIGGHDGAEAFSLSREFKEMNVGLVLDEGLASPGEDYRVFYGERSPWWMKIKATGAPGHGAKLYDGSAMENLVRSLESVMRFRRSQFDMVKSGERAEGEVVSVNLVYLKAGTPSPTPIGFVMNLQPSEAEAGLDIRIPPNADAAALERRIAEEWAPASRNMTYEFKQKAPLLDKFGNPAVTAADSSNPWLSLLEKAVKEAGGKLGKPEIFPASTDARYFRDLGIPALGFSPMANTPILLHDHNEFLHKGEYLKGIEIYESIIKTFASYGQQAKDQESKAEL